MGVWGEKTQVGKQGRVDHCTELRAGTESWRKGVNCIDLKFTKKNQQEREGEEENVEGKEEEKLLSAAVEAEAKWKRVSKSRSK